MDVVIVAVNSALAPLAYAEQSGIPFSSGGTAAIADTWHALPQLAASYTDPTAGVGGIEIYDYVPDLRGSRTTASMTAAPTTSFSLPRPNAATSTIQTILSTPDPGTDGAQQVITQVGDGTSTSYALDIGQATLPWLTTPVLDTTAYTMTLTVDGTQPVDLFAAKAFYVRGNCAGTPTEYTWHVFGPTPGNVTLPTLCRHTVGDIYPHATGGRSARRATRPTHTRASPT